MAEPTSTARTVRDAALWIEALLKQFPELLGELAPGRPSPAPPPSGGPSPEAAQRVREERLDALLVEKRHGLAVPGYSAAPLRLHVSDAVRDITDGVVELDEAVHDKLGLGRPRRAQVPQRLVRIAGLLGRIADHPRSPPTCGTSPAGWHAVAHACWATRSRWSGYGAAAPGATRCRCAPSPPAGRCSA